MEENMLADTVLGPVVWNVPRDDFSILSKFARRIYCMRNADKLRLFFLGMLAADKEMPAEDKTGYHAWLQKIDWVKFLGTTRDVAFWKLHVEKKSYPINATLFSGINCEYWRLFRCFKEGCRQDASGVV